jgi:hypothetical protein
MQYVLGNMLNGAGGLNPDGLALDLQFAADKTLTARKGPTPVFTRGSTGTFVGSNGLIQSAAVNIPRFDHTSAGVCRGLLIEESRTNSQRYSDDFSLWSVITAGGGSVTSNQTTAPDGSSNADLLAETATTGIHVISDQSISITSGTTYTISAFAKKGNGATAPDLIQLCGRGDTFGTTQFATFNISNGTVNSSSGGTASIQNFGNGWYRCVFVVTATATLANSGMVIAFVGSTPGVRQPSYNGLTTSNVFIWGAQLEAGSFATSYIPTVASSVVRSADVCSITGGNFTSITGSVGSPFSASVNFIADLSRLTAIAGSPLSFNTSSNNGIFLYKFNNSASFGVYHVSTNAIIGTLAAGPGKAAMAYDGDSVVGVLNNGTVSAEQGNSALAFTEMIIGSTRSGGNNFGGPISSVMVYRKRLPNAKIQSLTV